MKLVQISSNVYKLSVEVVVGIPVLINTWYIIDDDNVYIIDTGMNEYANLQVKVAKLLGNPQAIFLTHGHIDHIDGAKVVSETLNIPIYAHEKELPYINGQNPYPNKKEVENTGVAHKVSPLNEQLVSKLPFAYYLTPGHAPGHVIFYHKKDQSLICGDLFISNSSALHPPIYKFTYDMPRNIEEGSIIDIIKPKLISTSHGEDIVYNDSLYKYYKFSYEEE